MSVLYSTVVTVQGSASFPALYAAVIGSNVGAFFTPLGALAGIVWVSLLKQHKVEFSFARFVIFGTVISIPTLLASLLGLSIII
jgi:arsenical pump membrane protein